MIDDGSPPPQRIITRTLTLTTVETWTITIGPGGAREEVVIDQVAEEAKSFNAEEET